MTVTKAEFLITEADSKLLLNFKQLTRIQLKDNIQLCIWDGDTAGMRKKLSVSVTGVVSCLQSHNGPVTKQSQMQGLDAVTPCLSEMAIFLLHQIIQRRWVSFDRRLPFPLPCMTTLVNYVQILQQFMQNEVYK